MLAIIAMLMGVPASAGAAPAPTLKAPAANAAPITEGKSMTFEWSGALQGDPSALDRSFYRVELIRSASMPAGVQAEWTQVENFAQTEPGSATTTVSLGVPPAGEYRWRVCAWGVVNVVAANEIQQLPDGCSASRPITSVAANATKAIPGELKMEERKQVQGATRTVVVPGPAPKPIVEPQPRVEAPEPAAPVEEIAPAAFQTVGRTTAESGTGSATGLGANDLESATAASRTKSTGIKGALVDGLGGTIPFVPIPFWTLALLLACMPLLRVWRHSVLAMFDWPDGSIDGRGTFDNSTADLALVPVTTDIKHSTDRADGTVLAPDPAPHSDAPERRRHAA